MPATRLLLQGCPGQFKVKTAQNGGDSRTWLPPASTPLEPFCICSPVSADGFLSGNLFLLAATFCRTEKGKRKKLSHGKWWGFHLRARLGPPDGTTR